MRLTARRCPAHLTNRRAELERIADALITIETLTREELNELLAQ
jgi:ATP-dependent Zn protease